MIFSNVRDYDNIIDSLLAQELFMADTVGKIFAKIGL